MVEQQWVWTGHNVALAAAASFPASPQHKTPHMLSLPLPPSCLHPHTLSCHAPPAMCAGVLLSLLTKAPAEVSTADGAQQPHRSLMQAAVWHLSQPAQLPLKRIASGFYRPSQVGLPVAAAGPGTNFAHACFAFTPAACCPCCMLAGTPATCLGRRGK